MTSEPSAPIVLGKVLVIGGCGFLGYHVVDQLLNFPSEDNLQSPNPPPQKNSQKYSKVDAASLTFPSLRSRYPIYKNTEVHVLDLRCTRNRLPGATYHEGDICDPESLLSVFRKVKPEVVINTASPTYDAPRHILRKVNIDGTKTLIEVAGGVHGDWGGKCKAFAHTSSSSVVSDAISDLINADERWPYVRPHPVEYYTETKVEAEEIVLLSNRKHNNMLTCAIRPAGIVGEKDRGGIADGFLSTASLAPDWQLHLQLGAGNNLFDCTYVGNVAFGLAIAAEALLKTHSRFYDSGGASPLDHEKVDGEAFNVTNESPAYFWDLAHYVWTAYGRTIDPAKLWRLPTSFMVPVGALAELFAYFTGRKTKINRQTVKYATITRYYSCGKLRRRCGYTPLVGLEEGFGRSIREYMWREREEKEKKGQ